MIQARVRATLRHRSELALVAALLLFALAARLTVALTLPPWQGPDEPKHFEYVRLLVDKREQLWAERRPIRLDDASPELQREIIASMARNRYWEYTGRRPPDELPADFFEIWQGTSTQLKQTYSPYHWLAAAVLLPFRDLPLDEQVRVVRLYSTVLSGLTLLLTYLAVREVASRDWFVRIVSTGLVAALPMHVFVGGTINSDNLVTLLGAALVLVLTRGMRRGFSPVRLLLLVALLLLAVLTKRTAIGMLPALLAAGVVSLVGWRDRRIVAAGLTAIALLVGASVAALAGIGPLAGLRHGLASYFLNDPTQLERLVDGLATPEAWTLATLLLAELFRSFWGVFGWYTVGLSQPLYDALYIATAVCGLGVLVGPWPRAGAPRGVLVVYLVAVAAMVALSVGERLAYLDPTQVPQGRYLFVAIVPIAVLLATGARSFLPRVWLGAWVPGLLALGLILAFDAAILMEYYLPWYVQRQFQ